MTRTLGPQFTYPTDLESTGRAENLPFHQVYRLHGTRNIDSLFPGGVVTAPSPWPSIGRTKGRPLYDHDAVTAALMKAPELEELDPRMLHANQSGITRAGVDYYMTPQYRQTGETFADKNNVGNAYPVVYSDLRGRNVILSGHHRATAALLLGVPHIARRIRGSI